MPKSIVEHGADWYNDDERVECPECGNGDYENMTVELVHGTKEYSGNVLLEGPGALVKCHDCKCAWFLERSK